MEESVKYERKWFRLFSPKMQFKIALTTFYISILGYGLIYIFTKMQWLHLSTLTSSECSPDALEYINTQTHGLDFNLLLWMLGVSLYLILASLIVTQTIAGPAYAIEKFLKDYKEGKSTDKLVLRKNDEFKEIARLINELIDQKKL